MITVANNATSDRYLSLGANRAILAASALCVVGAFTAVWARVAETGQA